MCLHMPVITPYVLVAVGIYGLDHLVRLFKTRVTTARIRPLPELSLTRVEIPTLNSGWRAGQHVRLRVLSSGMGWWGWTESHPFTIASVSDAEEGMVLMCKKAGSWTSKLYEMAKASGYGENGKGSGGNVKVIVEGPYGMSLYIICRIRSNEVRIRRSWPYSIFELFRRGICLWRQRHLVCSFSNSGARPEGLGGEESS